MGFGHHARRIYYPVLDIEEEQYKFVIADLTEQEGSINEFLFSKNSTPEEILLFDQFPETMSELPEIVESKLNKLHTKHNFSGIIISTDPLYHKHYAKWALRNDISILMDKPIVVHKNMSTDINAAEKMNLDFDELNDLYIQKPNLFFSVVSQRRFHKGFHKIKELIREVFEETNCPITSIQITHADGQWRLPNEIIDINYHSFNQGFGKCAHSGYHFIDIINFFFDATSSNNKKINAVETIATFLRPSDFVAQMTLGDYQKLFPDFNKYNSYSDKELRSKMEKFGEIDAFVTFNFKKDDDTITLCSLNLIHNSFSQRGNLFPNQDLYKGNGRVRHESYIIQQGPFQCIHVDSLQSKEVKCEEKPNYETGGEYHFDIHVFRNDKFNDKWNNYDKITIRDLQKSVMSEKSRGHQEDARRAATMEFLNYLEDNNKDDKISDLKSHKNSVRLMTAIYKSAALKACNQNPLVMIEYE